jgi:hypothetical protein
MKREKILSCVNNFRVNYVESMYLVLGTSIASALLQTTAMSMTPKSVLYKIEDDSPLLESVTQDKQGYISSTVRLKNKLRSYSTQKLRNQLRSSSLNSKVEALSSQLFPEEDEQFRKPEMSVTTAKRIAQADSSGFVGDTLGEINKLRQQLLIDPIVIERKGVVAPASTAGTPTGFGASWGQAYLGIGGFFPFDEGDVDGSAVAGFGLGNALKSVGVEINVNITSLGSENFDFADSGALGFKVHKYFSDGTAVAVGWANPVKWGDADRAEDTVYGVVTKSFDLQPNNPNNSLPLTVSLGIGSGSFRSKGAIEADENSVNVFGSLGLRIIPQVSLATSWTGNSLNIGASFAPLRNTPLVINTIFTDVTDNLDRSTGLSISAGYVFRF